VVGARRVIRRVALCILGAISLGGSTQIAWAQTTWDRYQPGTLSAIIKAQDSTIRAEAAGDKNPSYHFSGDQFPTRARVTYRGESRPVDSMRREVVRRWGLAFHRDSSIANDFHREYLFQEGQESLWLPVQDTVASFFARELKSGQPVTLYVMWLGAYYHEGTIEWAFIVNEFSTKPVRQGF
jgi:hypothetical protein